MSRTLANKYRPTSFSNLKGQEVLVKTITSAIISGKPFNAYLLTGIRGIGKTTSARIIARTLNCFALRVENNSAIPCNACKSCLALQDDCHPDVIEIDAASKTGVNDIRDLIDSAQYAPMFGKYKIYIVDEVHMLSNSAFNALLKILEEPPLNVVFIFATTECRKIPMTVISRCQKFDLHRFTLNALVEHLAEICTLESIRYDEFGLAQIAKYSDGSMRDALSLLETIASYKNAEAIVNESLVSQVLGLSNIDCKYKLFWSILNGDIKQALDIIAQAYEAGGDLFSMFEGLLSICNAASKVIAIKDYIQVLNLPHSEKASIKAIADQTDISSLATIWQALFKGIQDLKLASNTFEAAEILLIKLAHLSTLPSLNEILNCKHEKKMLFKDIVELFKTHGEMMLYYQLRSEVEVIHYADSKLSLKIGSSLPTDFATQVAKKLREWTKSQWIVSAEASSDIRNTLKSQEEELLKTSDGVIRDVLQSFPGARIESVVDVK